MCLVFVGLFNLEHFPIYGNYACLNYASLLLRTLGCFEAANTASLAALIVAGGSILDNGPSGTGMLLDIGLKYQ